MRVVVVNQNNNSWSLPKGHLESGESLLEAAQREIHEECGVKDLVKIVKLGTYRRPKIALGGGNDKSEIKQITLFLFFTREKKLKPLDKDNPSARWVALDEVSKKLTHPKDSVFYESNKSKIKRQILKYIFKNKMS